MEATLNKNENYTWKFVKKPGNIMEFVIVEKWEPCGWRLLGFPQFSTCWQTFLSGAHHERSHHWCFGRPCAQGSAISAFNLLAVHRCVLCRQGFSSLVCQAVVGATANVYTKGLSAVLEGMGRLVCSRGCTKQCHIFL